MLPSPAKRSPLQKLVLFRPHPQGKCKKCDKQTGQDVCGVVLAGEDSGNTAAAGKSGKKNQERQPVFPENAFLTEGRDQEAAKQEC